MTYLLDTNACIDHLRHGIASKITRKLAGMPVGSVVLCSVVVAELLYGAHRSAKKSITLGKVQSFASQFVSLPFDDRAAEEYGLIRALLEGMGTPIGPNDLMIASIAKANQLTVVSRNIGEFSRVPGLTVEDWQV